MRIFQRTRHFLHRKVVNFANQSRLSIQFKKKNDAATNNYSDIIRSYPDQALNKDRKKEIELYCTDVLGDVRHSPGLWAYTAWRGKFIEGWIPQTFFSFNVLPQLQRGMEFLGHLRTLQSRLYGKDHFPDLLCCINGVWMSPDHDLRFSIEDVAPILFNLHEKVYVKTNFSRRSESVRLIRRDVFNPNEIASAGDCVVQAPIRQDESLAAFMPDNVATIRINTFLDSNGKIHNRANFVRFGRTGHTSYGEVSPIIVAVIDQYGRISDTAIDRAWNPMIRHPDTNMLFAGYTLPSYNQACKLCERLHGSLPFVGTIGWDIAIDYNGVPKIIELNTDQPSVLYVEPMSGPHFSDMRWEQFASKRQ